MAKQTLNTLKQFFKTALKPTQQQFWDWLDSFWHKDDKIPLTSLDGLQDELDKKASKEYIDALASSPIDTAYIDVNGHLIIVMKSTEVIDCGQVLFSDANYLKYADFVTTGGEGKVLAAINADKFSGKTKAEIITELNLLYAAVTHSHSYNSLTDKPSIPSVTGLMVETDFVGDDAPKQVQSAISADFASAANTDVQYNVIHTTYATKTENSTKVDKVTGKGLTPEEYTLAEKNKLAGLDSNHFKGLHLTFAALNAAHPTAVAGDYAEVDAATSGTDVSQYLWDVSDAKWVEKTGGAGSETAATVKTKYESNPDTNAFTDTLKAKLNAFTANFTSELKTAYDAKLAGTKAAIEALLTGVISSHSHAVTKSDVGLGNVPNLAFSGSNTGDQVIQYPLVANAASSGTITLATNTLTQLTTAQNASTFTIAFGAQVANYANEYLVRFVCGAGVPTISYPANIKWVGGVAPTFAANKTYLLSFIYYDANNIDVNYISIG